MSGEFSVKEMLNKLQLEKEVEQQRKLICISDVCSECGSPLRREGGCLVCYDCGESSC